jgi:aspartate-semialdehyde dehydrogenase
MASRKPLGSRDRKAHVALFDATSLIAKGVKEQLVGRSFPIASVRLYTSSSDPDANLTEFDGQAAFVAQPDFDALGELDIAFLCGSPAEAAQYLEWPERRGFVAIDLSTAAQGEAAAPLVNAAVNPDDVPGRPGLIATPHAAALMLSTVLAAVRQGCGLQEAAAVVMLPVSEFGEAGIGELYQQAVGMLNFQEMPQALFGRQMAFNLMPGFEQGGAAPPALPSGSTLRREIERVTGGGFELSVAVVLAPVFHCHAAMVRVVLPPGRGRPDLIGALRSEAEIRLAVEGGPVTPVERAGESGILVAGLEPAGGGSGYWLWIVTDDQTTGSALNAVRIAETVWSRSAPRQERS